MSLLPGNEDIIMSEATLASRILRNASVKENKHGTDTYRPIYAGAGRTA